MKKKHAYDEAVRASSDLRDGYEKRKSMLFVAVAVVIPIVVSLVLQYINATISVGADIETVKQWFIDNIIGACNTGVKLAVTAVLGYALTKSKYGIVVFLAVCSLGSYIGGIVGDAFNAVAEFTFQPEENPFSLFSLAVTVISGVASVFISCVLYDKLVGLGEITPVSDSIYSSARKRIIVTYIIIFILGAILSGAVTAVEVFLMQNTLFSSYSFASSGGFSLLLSVLNFAIVYFAGRGIRKNRADGLKLVGCYSFPNIVMSVVLIVLMLIFGAIANFSGLVTILADTTGTDQLNALVMVSSGGGSVITVIMDIVLRLWVVKYIFPPEVAEETDKEEFMPREVHFKGIYSETETEQGNETD